MGKLHPSQIWQPEPECLVGRGGGGGLLCFPVNKFRFDVDLRCNLPSVLPTGGPRSPFPHHLLGEEPALRWRPPEVHRRLRRPVRRDGSGPDGVQEGPYYCP